MARKQSPAAPPPETVTFEEAYANLENIGA